MTSVANEKTVELATLQQIPYGFVDAQNNEIGFLYEILELIHSGSELQANHETVPPERLIRGLESGIYDCTLLAGTPLVIDKFELVGSIGFVLSAGVLPGTGVSIPDYDSLYNVTIAVPSGIYFDRIFDNDKKIKKEVPPFYKNAILMLKHGRVDAVAGGISSLLYIAKKEGMTLNDFGTPLVFSTFDVYLTCNRDVDPEISSQLLSSLEVLIKENEIMPVIERYLNF